MLEGLVILLIMAVLTALVVWVNMRKPKRQPPDDPEALLEHDPYTEARQMLNQIKDEVKAEKARRRKPP